MKARNVYDKFQCSLFLCFFLLLLTCLSSCYPEFKNPIHPPSELKADHQILGTWVRTYKGGQSEYKEQLSIFQRSNGWIDVVWIYDINKKESTDGINLLVLEGYSTSVNKECFLCLRFREKDYTWSGQNDRPSNIQAGKQPFTKNWIIANYKTPNNDELVIRPFSTRKVEELIETGNLKGDIVKEELFRTPEQPLDHVTVTSSSDELANEIYKKGAGAFVWDDPNDTFHPINVLVFSRNENKTGHVPIYQ